MNSKRRFWFGVLFFSVFVGMFVLFVGGALAIAGGDCGFGRGGLSQEESEKRWVEYNTKREEMKEVDQVRTDSVGEHVQVFLSEGDDVLELQYEINQWLEMNPGIEILSRTQSSAGEDRKSTTVVLWYRRDSEKPLPLWGLW